MLNADGTFVYDSQKITLEYQLDTSTSTDLVIYTDAESQYAAAATSIKDSSLTSLTNGPTDPAVKNFFFVRKNGLGPLRDVSEKEAENFYNYYLTKSDNYNILFLILMIVGLALLIVSELILLPIIFSIHRTNICMLSLFGYIPSNDVNALINAYDDYMENYLADYQEWRDPSIVDGEESIKQTENAGSSYRKISQEDQEQLDPKGLMSPDMRQVRISPSPLLKSPDTENHEPKTIDKSSANLTSSQQDKYSQNKETSDKNKNETQSQKILNSKYGRRTRVLIQFIGFALLFSLYFFLNYLWLEKDFIKQLEMDLLHFKLSAQRASQVRYLIAFTLEEIAEADLNSVYSFSGIKRFKFII